jgi:hypothetical protein
MLRNLRGRNESAFTEQLEATIHDLHAAAADAAQLSDNNHTVNCHRSCSSHVATHLWPV